MNVRLGYTVGGGAAVDIPVRHMAITGQTLALLALRGLRRKDAGARQPLA